MSGNVLADDNNVVLSKAHNDPSQKATTVALDNSASSADITNSGSSTAAVSTGTSTSSSQNQRTRNAAAAAVGVHDSSASSANSSAATKQLRSTLETPQNSLPSYQPKRASSPAERSFSPGGASSAQQRLSEATTTASQAELLRKIEVRTCTCALYVFSTI